MMTDEVLQIDEDRFSENKLRESEQEESSFFIEGDSEKIEEKDKKRISLALRLTIGTLGVIFLAVGSYSVIKGEKEPRFELEPSAVNRSAIRKDHQFTFSSFVIPLNEDKTFTYISLSISFDVPNSELRAEIIGNEERLRGIIFDRLRETVNSADQIPPLGTLKALIVEEVNRQLVSGQLREVYIIEFQAV